MARRHLDIAIVGAGLGGLAAARALQILGFRPLVYEQAPVLGEVGAGITMTPNAVKALRFLGLEGALRARAEEPPTQETRHGATDELLFAFDRSATAETYGAPYLMLHRADLAALLADAVLTHDPDAIRLDARLETAVMDRRRPQLSFASGEVMTPSLVIAADGLKSRLRAALFGDGEARFTGHMAFRAMIPASAAPAEALAPGSKVWIGHGANLVRYRLRGGALVNVVGLARAAAWTAEGWSHRAARADFAAAFAGFCAPVKALIDAAPEDVIWQWGLFSRPPLPAFHGGRIALIGDAAHPMLPFMGQGAAMALEDAVVLARCLAEEPTIAAALSAYSAARHPRATMIQTESALGADRLQALDPERLRNAPPKGEDALGIFHYDPGSAAI